MPAGKRTRLLLVAATLMVPTLAVLPASAAPPRVTLDSAVDGYASYEPQAGCLHEVQSGLEALRELIATEYPAQAAFLTLRDCGIGGVSEHKEGRALDWMLDVDDPADDRVAWDFLTWLRAEEEGQPDARMRRLGIMYIIWDGEILRAYRPVLGWEPYRGPDPHTNHMHISLSWAGARQQTSWWTATRTTP